MRRETYSTFIGFNEGKGMNFSSTRLPVLLTVLLAVTAAPLFSQPYNPAEGYELVNSGEQWNSLSKLSRTLYLRGFVDGGAHSHLATMNDIPYARWQALGRETATMYDKASIRDVMTNLYGDPANTYISLTAMVYIARDKLSGKDIEPMLRRAREQDREYYSSSK